MFPWENEKWYQAHKPRWEALEARGWNFGRAETPFGLTGIRMSGGPLGESFFLMTQGRSSSEAEQIHAKLLSKCEYHAGPQNT